MKATWSKKVDEIMAVGRSLEDVGIHNWALTREQAMGVLEQFESEGIGVLGGDVYELQCGVLQSNYGNWWCQKSVGESREDFVIRSIEKARSYIGEYRMDSNVPFLFAIVPMPLANF